MGFFDLFSKEGRVKSARQRNITRVSSKYAQSPDRFAAMEKLRQDGSDEALFGLMKRFSFKYDKTIEDEQEKEWVVQVMQEKGEAAIPAVIRYAKEADSWSWSLKILDHILRGEKLLPVLDELLAREEPTYTRDPSRKLEALTFLADWRGVSDAEIARRIVPYVADFDEGVRFQAIEAISHHPDEATVREALLAALLRPEEESRRIKVRAAGLLAEHGWSLGDHEAAVAALAAQALPEFTVDTKTHKLRKAK
jgi:hypothetical protein